MEIFLTYGSRKFRKKVHIKLKVTDRLTLCNSTNIGIEKSVDSNDNLGDYVCELCLRELYKKSSIDKFNSQL